MRERDRGDHIPGLTRITERGPQMSVRCRRCGRPTWVDAGGAPLCALHDLQERLARGRARRRRRMLESLAMLAGAGTLYGFGLHYGTWGDPTGAYMAVLCGTVGTLLARHAWDRLR